MVRLPIAAGSGFRGTMGRCCEPTPSLVCFCLGVAVAITWYWLWPCDPLGVVCIAYLWGSQSSGPGFSTGFTRVSSVCLELRGDGLCAHEEFSVKVVGCSSTIYNTWFPIWVPIVYWDSIVFQSLVNPLIQTTDSHGWFPIGLQHFCSITIFGESIDSNNQITPGSFTYPYAVGLYPCHQGPPRVPAE